MKMSVGQMMQEWMKSSGAEDKLLCSLLAPFHWQYETTYRRARPLSSLLRHLRQWSSLYNMVQHDMATSRRQSPYCQTRPLFVSIFLVVLCLDLVAFESPACSLKPLCFPRFKEFFESQNSLEIYTRFLWIFVTGNYVQNEGGVGNDFLNNA